MTNLATNLQNAAATWPDRTAVKLDDVELSYRWLDQASARVASLLAARGVGPGDRVGIMLPNVPYFPIVYYGVLRAGGVVVPMNVLLKHREVEYYLGDSGAREAFVWGQFAGEAPSSAIVVAPGTLEQMLAEVAPTEGVVERAGTDTAVILYTSGTTGHPKGAELTHDNLRLNVAGIVDLFTLTSEDVIFGALPLFHSFGQTCALNAATAAGACLTLLPRFDADKALEIIDRDKVTMFEGVPTMYVAMLHSDRAASTDASSLRVCASGGASMPVEVLRSFEQQFRCKVREGYGLSETSPVASFNHVDREAKPGSIGTPMAGVEMKVVDESDAEVAQGEIGEIVIRGHNVMKGYWQRPQETADAMRGGWFHTGDMARIDEEGYFFIVDRKKDLIIRGGYNVYPREVEEVLYEHPGVREAAVVGVPHPDLGEEVGAAVVLKPGADASAHDLSEFVKERVAAYKYPRLVWFVDELPKGPTGKILKREVIVPASLGAGAS